MKPKHDVNIKTLKRSGRIITNTHCGLVIGFDHKQVFGCGDKPRAYKEYWYDLVSIKGLSSSVVLCRKCEAKYVGKRKRGTPTKRAA